MNCSEFLMDRIKDKIQCNPTVKLTKGETYPFVGIDRITSGNRDIAIADMEVYSGQSCSKFRKGDAIMARITPYLENGKIAQYNLDSEIAMGSTELFVFREIENISDNDYIYYLISTDYVRNNAVNSMTGASGRQRADIKFIGKLKWDFPEYDVQCKIGKILSTYDDLIEKNNRKIEILQDMAEELYKEWFVRFRFPGYKTAKFIDGIPEGWEYIKLENLAYISTGKCNREDAEEDGIYPLFDRSQEIKKSNNWLKDCEAIIVPGEGTSFIPRYYKGKFNLHQRCYCVEPKQDNIGFFLYQTLMLNRIYFLYVATGATVPSLRQNNFTNFKVLMPKKELYTAYNKYSTTWFEEITKLEYQNENLKQQRDLLLPRLMSGKLEVKVS